MADNNHLNILKKGVSHWNTWREENPKIKPDLSNCLLSDSKTAIGKVNCDFEKRNLQGINFSNTNLSKSTIRGANLYNSNFENANLYRADLRASNLKNSNLKNSKLNLTNLTLVKLVNSNLTGALFWETIVARTNLSGAKGLEHTKHGGPSVIDHRTFRKSGVLPKKFLKRIGLPDNLIELFNNQDFNDHTYQSCFISHSSRDEIFVKKLHHTLQRQGIRTWYSSEDLEIGDKFRETIESAIDEYDKVLIVLSDNSITSGWVEDEIDAVMEKEYLRKMVAILPISIDQNYHESSVAWVKKLRRSRHIGDFSNWTSQKDLQDSTKKLLKALKE